MEDSNSSINDDENLFFDALDEFPFYNCTDSNENDRPISQSSSISQLGPVEESNPDAGLQKSKLRRRRTFSQHVRKDISSSGGDLKDLNNSSSVSFGSSDTRLVDSAREFRFLRNLKEIERESKSSDLNNVNNRLKEEIKKKSVITYENNVTPDESIAVGSVKNPLEAEITENSVVTDANSGRTNESNTVDSRVGVVDDSSSHFLYSLAVLVIKAIVFQVNLFVSLITFPIWLVYSSYMFVTDPFHVMRRCRAYFAAKLLRIWGAIYGSVSPMVYEWFKEHKSIFKLGLRFGWGMLWSVYVCFVLVSLLVSAFLIGGLFTRVLVEKPIQMKETLNFDYTKHSPVAFVPIISCPDVSCGMNCREKIETGKLGGSRVLPANYKLQVTVSLTLPESDYNRNLGIFQVRVDLLSANGYALSSSRHHSMLQFRSQPIRLLLTFLKIAPLLAGFYSETQTLNIKFRGLTERDIPTVCLRVIIEQRAEFRPGAGIPEVYASSLSLESELPMLKRILWSWKKTIFIWLSMTVFTMELLFALLCCKPLILPRARPSSSTNASASLNRSPVQR